MNTNIEVNDKYNLIYSGTANELQVTLDGNLIAKLDYLEGWSVEYKNEALDRIMQVASAMNNTYGKGINPALVPELLDLCQKLKLVLSGYMADDDSAPTEDYDLLDKADSIINKATL